MSHVKEPNRRKSRQQENDIKPSMVKVELQITQNLGNDRSIFKRHVHPHKNNRGNKIHPHDLCQ